MRVHDKYRQAISRRMVRRLLNVEPKALIHLRATATLIANELHEYVCAYDIFVEFEPLDCLNRSIEIAQRALSTRHSNAIVKMIA